MKALRIILASLYPILIGLLVLTNLNSCKHGATESAKLPDSSETTTKEDTSKVTPELPRDTASIVKQAEEVGKSGGLKITLLWDFEGDIDLHVKQPNGKEIWFDDAEDRTTGGYLDVDNTYGGKDSAENIFWENPPKGTYSITLDYYQPSEKTRKAESGVCTVVVFKEGQEPMVNTVQMRSVGSKSTTLKVEI